MKQLQGVLGLFLMQTTDLVTIISNASGLFSSLLQLGIGALTLYEILKTRRK